MQEESLPEKIGHFRLIRLISRGGMGEVFLARDEHCQRDVALKRIRPHLRHLEIMQKRFLNEAWIAAHLTHPGVIPIYTLDRETFFYTMPHIEGETIRQILNTALKEARQGEIKHPIGSSIPALARIFLQIVEAISYAHAHGIVHRDIKADNVMVGKYGEVLLLDWGLAQLLSSEKEKEFFSPPGSGTQPGKIPGTLSYLAPERASGQKATPQSDIYSLGVLLYYMLTLHIPFHRSSLRSLKKTGHLETFIDPFELAPSRDIPDQLARIAKKCLQFRPEERFANAEEMVSELINFIEGKPEWVLATRLHIEEKSDWLLQENILLTRELAITRAPDLMEWVHVMLSKDSYIPHVKIDVRVTLHAQGQGIGILLAIPDKQWLESGMSLWWGREGFSLLYGGIVVLSIPELHLEPLRAYTLSAEWLDNRLQIAVDETLRASYITHFPNVQGRVGLLLRDREFALHDFAIYVGSRNAQINCLSVPDAFFAQKQYETAAREYKRIASSFPGRTEGREALFRLGIATLSEGKEKKSKRERARYYFAALEQFGQLRLTPNAPLEYLGKSFVYREMHDIDEEIKCLELALRKYPKHPLTKELIHQIGFRMHESASTERSAAFHFLLLALRHARELFSLPVHKQLLDHVKEHLEPLPFLPPPDNEDALKLHLSFWLAHPFSLLELVEHSSLAQEATSALYLLGFLDEMQVPITSVHPYVRMDRELLFGKPENVVQYALVEATPSFDALKICALLLLHKKEEAKRALERHSLQELTSPKSPLYPLMGCYLRAAEGETAAMKHFQSEFDQPYPPLSMLLSAYLRNALPKSWITQALPWEKVHLFRQLHVYYLCADNPQAAKRALAAAKKEYSYVHAKHPYP